MNQVSYFVYSSIPGAGKGWSLAVLATGRVDADNYIRTHNRGAKFSYSVQHGGTVKADCGAVTSAAHQVISDPVGV